MAQRSLRCCLVTLIMAGAICLAPPAWAVVVGGKNFTEQLLVVEMTAQLLRAKGIPVTTRTGFATSGVRTEQEMGHIDLYWEYTGTALVNFNKIAEKLHPEETFRRVKELDFERGLIWLSPSSVNNTYGLAMRKADAATMGIASISDLAAKARGGEKFRLASNLEFFLRPDGLRPLQRAYSFEFGQENVVRMETDAVYDVLRNSLAFDVGVVFSTDGRVSAFGLSVLQDDRHFFPSYVLAPVVRREALEKHPEIAEHLGVLATKLDDATISRLNAMVDLQKRPVEEVASSFLATNGLF